jgi:lipoprotein-anchoring transpeptidase ErfK/SrfK
MGSLIGVAVMLAAGSCVQETSNRTASPAANTNATSNAPASTQPAPATTEPAPAKADNAALKDQTLTLPLLDAFFAQESFADDLKAKLQLTDAQVNQLRTIARQETSKLHESNNDDQHIGGATAARQQASEKVKEAIGVQKSGELIAFVTERWSSGVAPATTSSATPSSIPQDTRIVVNAPAFRMDIFEDGRLIKSYKIGIGYPEFPLPTGLRKADTIIFNPSWTPPDEPWVESANSKVKVGEKVAAGDKLNPLGPIKIPIGLPSLIHGGKSPAKLGGFASHGCVGLTTPQVTDFADRLAQLTGTQLTRDQMSEYMKHKTETKPVKLARPVPVELRYDSITVEDGKLHIYRDVYERGTNTEDNLRTVLQSYGVSFDQLSDRTRADAMRALSAMSRNAGGKPVTEPDSSSAHNKNASGTVTRLIKGTKEAVINLPGLTGQSYPAPVDLDTGVPAKTAAPRARRRR